MPNETITALALALAAAVAAIAAAEEPRVLVTQLYRDLQAAGLAEAAAAELTHQIHIAAQRAALEEVSQ